MYDVRDLKDREGETQNKVDCRYVIWKRGAGKGYFLIFGSRSNSWQYSLISSTRFRSGRVKYIGLSMRILIASRATIIASMA